MANKHLRKQAKWVGGNADIWWYENIGGIEIHVDCQNECTGEVVEHKVGKISWQALRGALARKDRRG